MGSKGQTDDMHYKYFYQKAQNAKKCSSKHCLIVFLDIFSLFVNLQSGESVGVRSNKKVMTCEAFSSITVNTTKSEEPKVNKDLKNCGNIDDDLLDY